MIRSASPSNCWSALVMGPGALDSASAVHRRVNVACEARSTAPKAPRPRSGLGTRLFNFVTGARFYQ